MERRRRVVAAVAAGMMYQEAEEEAAQLRQRIQQMRERMGFKRQRRNAMLACLAIVDQPEPTRRYAQVIKEVPILQLYFSGGDTKPALRLSRVSVAMLINMLPREKDHGWSHELEVLVTLYWMASGLSYRVTGDVFGIPTSTCHRIVHNVVDQMMAEVLHRVIHFPKPEEMDQVGADFAWMAGHQAFRHVAGAIDGCHVRIVPPKLPQKKCYVNRKLFPSLLLQGICDANSRFLDIYVGQPGTVHDALALRRSPIFKQSLYPPEGYFLLGDGGYPCLQHPVALMTPYRRPVASQVQARYNLHHAKGRLIIERTFGKLKTRWRMIFLRALEIRPIFAPKVIAACCILHNICVAAGDILEEEEEDDDEEGPDPVEEDGEADGDERDRSGNNIRERLAAEISAPDGLDGCLADHDYL